MAAVATSSRIEASTQTPPSITIPQSRWEDRTVEAATDTAKTLTPKSWLNIAAHIATIIPHALLNVTFALSTTILATASIIVFPPSALLVVPGLFAINFIFIDATRSLFDAAHDQINKTIK